MLTPGFAGDPAHSANLSLRMSTFRDSIVTNLVKLVDVMPRLNVTGDPELERLTDQVKASLLVDPAELRKSESVCTETATKAARIVQQLSAYMAGYQLTAVAAAATASS